MRFILSSEGKLPKYFHLPMGDRLGITCRTAHRSLCLRMVCAEGQQINFEAWFACKIALAQRSIRVTGPGTAQWPPILGGCKGDCWWRVIQTVTYPKRVMVGVGA
jgi:hypothetical protein